MSRPVRIQLRRTKGWRLPPNTIVVSRPTKWGNPFRSSLYSPKQAVELYRTAIMGAMPIAFAAGLVRRAEIMELARAQVDKLGALPLRDLKGKNLACWCPLDQPCHADVILDIANSEATGAPRSGTETEEAPRKVDTKTPAAPPPSPRE